MPHSLAANNGASHLNSAFFANNILVAYSTIFAAITLVIFFRTENPFVKKTAAFAASGAVIYGFRLGYFSIRPLANTLRRCHSQN